MCDLLTKTSHERVKKVQYYNMGTYLIAAEIFLMSAFFLLFTTASCLLKHFVMTSSSNELVVW